MVHKQNFDRFYEHVSLSMETSILYSWKQDIYKFFEDGFFRSCHFGRLTKNPLFGLSDQQGGVRSSKKLTPVALCMIKMTSSMSHNKS
jgi:hypothetical protein